MSKISTKVAKKYAAALFESCSLAELDTVRIETENLKELSEKHRDILKQLQSPKFIESQKSDALVAIAIKSGCQDSRVLNLLRVLVQNNRIEYIALVAEVFSSIVDEMKKSLSIEIESATPLTEEERSAADNSVRNEFHGLATIQWKVNPEIIGGLKIRAGDKLYDRSVLHSLKQAEQILLG